MIKKKVVSDWLLGTMVISNGLIGDQASHTTGELAIPAVLVHIYSICEFSCVLNAGQSLMSDQKSLDLLLSSFSNTKVAKMV